MCIVLSDFVLKHVDFIVFESRQVLPLSESGRGERSASDTSDDV